MASQSKFKLIRRGVGNYFLRRPYCVSFEVTYNCNARCLHCHLGENIKEDLAMPARYAEVARALKPVVGQVSGGEPLLRPEVAEIVAALRGPGRVPFVALTTNGWLLPGKYKALREAGVGEFSLSMDYPDERHDEFRKIKGLFRRISDFLDTLKDLPDKAITLSCVIQRDNFRELPKLAEFAASKGVRLNFSTYTWLRTKKQDYMIPAGELDELRAVLGRIKDFKRTRGVVFTSDYVLDHIPDFFRDKGMAGCSAGRKFLVCNPDGTLSPCGLIIRKYGSRRQVLREFTRGNDCIDCFTSIRANQEKPLRFHIKDNMGRLRRKTA